MTQSSIKPIKTEADYALERIEQLMESEPDTAESDELDVLTTLVEAYEEQHYPINLPDPIAAITFRMEQAGLSQRDLIPYIGSRSKVSEVLTRKRSLTLSMIRALHEHLNIPADKNLTLLFLKPQRISIGLNIPLKKWLSEAGLKTAQVSQTGLRILSED